MGGIRVPLMIRWPGLTEEGALCHAMVTSADFFPTFAEGLGLDSADLPTLDGVSLMPLLRDPVAEPERQTLHWHYPHYYPRMTPGSAVRKGDWKLIHYYEDDRSELFNLKTDPAETQDVSDSHPERARDLRANLDKWRQSIGANVPVSNPNWHQRKLSLLYGSGQHAGISTRLQGYEVKLFSTSSRYQSSRTTGRDYPANETKEGN